MPAAGSHETPINPGGRALNRRGDGQRLRAEIIGAAMRLLEKIPAQEVSLRAIAREARITAPAIYYHFRNRDEIIFGLVRAAWEDLASEMSRADEQAASSGPLAQLRAQVHAYLAFALASPTRYQLLFSLQPDPALIKRVRTDQPVTPVYHVLEHAVQRCIQAGLRLILDNAPDMTVLVFVIAHGRVALSHAVPGQDFSRPEVIAAYVDVVLDAIVSAP